MRVVKFVQMLLDVLLIVDDDLCDFLLQLLIELPNLLFKLVKLSISNHMFSNNLSKLPSIGIAMIS